MKKKIVLLAMSAIMTLTLIGGCGKKVEEPSAQSEEAEALDETTEVEEAEASSDADDSWKQLYLDYLDNELTKLDTEDLDSWQFGFIYVNDDDIPELVCSSGYEAAGNVLLTVVNGKVYDLQSSRLNFYYIERGNILDNSDGHMGYYYDRMFSIGDEGFELEFDGAYEMVVNEDETDYVLDEYNYYIDSESVTEEKYKESVEKLTPHDKKKSWAAGTTLHNMKQYLSGDVYVDYRAAYKDIISNGIEGTGGERLYSYALTDRPGRDPMLIAIGDEEFRFISFDDGLLSVGPSWYFSSDSENIFVFTTTGEIMNFTHYGEGDSSANSFYTMQDGSVTAVYYSSYKKTDWDAEPILDDNGDPTYVYEFNGVQVEGKEYNDELSEYDEVFKFELVPANADETYIEYYDMYDMEDVLAAFG